VNVRPGHPILPGTPALDVLGVPVAELGWHEAIAMLAGRIARREFTPITFLNAHNANVACADADFAATLPGFLVLPDGVGVDIAAKWLHGRPFPANLNGTDFVPALIAAIESPITVALLGATRENAGGAAEELALKAPHHRYVVIHDGFFAAEQEPGIIARIAEVRPDILLVAMGVPRQELWNARHLTAQHCTMPIAVGALLDFLSGAVPRAPLGMRKARMEWIFRLWIEPGRLWRRYIVGNPLFLLRVARDKLAGAQRRAG
jgi:exopolysaccharide biosynthesis WecB/TagA/CpsF family protein